MSGSADRSSGPLWQAVAGYRAGVPGRVLTWPQSRNTRELGDIPLAGGGRTRRGVLVRSDSLARLDEQGVAAALDHGVRTVVDLREPWLRARSPDPAALLDAVRYHHVPLLPADFPLPVPIAEYPTALRLSAPRLAEIVALIAAGPGACVFHCHSGTGRTGLVALTLLALSGAEPAAILADHVYDPESASGTAGDGPEQAERLAAAARLLDEIRDAGGAAEFLRAAGASEDDLATLYRRLVDTGADPVHPTQAGTR